MSTQPEALRLADAMDAVNKNNADSLLVQMAARSASAELRRLYWDELRVRDHRDEMCAEVTRLHAINAELVEALKSELALRVIGQHPDVHWESLRDMRRSVYAATDAVLAKAEGREA